LDVDSANIVAGVCDSKGKSMMECFVKTDSIFRAGKAVETAALLETVEKSFKGRGSSLSDFSTSSHSFGGWVSFPGKNQ
jgi:hypothetical protein